MDAERIEVEPRSMVGVHELVTLSELPSVFGRALVMVTEELERQGAAPAGPPVALYQGITSDKVDVTVGFPVDRSVVPAHDVVVVTLPGGPAVQTVHIGPYDRLHETYAELSQWMSARGVTPAGSMWEQYLVGRDVDPDPARWRTLIVYPIVD
jgi:effector-binding domain-containing protein